MIREYGNGLWLRVALCGCLAIPLLLCGCKDAPAPVDTRLGDEEIIRGMDVEWSMAAQTNKLDEVMSYYSEDASLLPPNAPMATGKAAIREVWASLLGPGVTVSWHASKIEVARSGDLAYLVGTYVLNVENPDSKPIRDHGKIIEVWKKTVNDGWKAVADTWNSDVPVVVDEGKKK